MHRGVFHDFSAWDLEKSILNAKGKIKIVVTRGNKYRINSTR